MPFEVFSTFVRCADLHGTHAKLEDADRCLAEIIAGSQSEIPIHPISGKRIHAIAAIKKDGVQRNFTARERKLASHLHLDSDFILSETAKLTTFNELASLYVEALRLVPILHVNLDGLFDRHNIAEHFWNTDAGKGQCLAYVQQGALTLELSLKALLEVLGLLTEESSEQKPAWQVHSPVVLFRRLPAQEKQALEQEWRLIPLSERESQGTFSHFLGSTDTLYVDWRYFDKEVSRINPQAHVGDLLRASNIVLNVAHASFRKRWPMEFKVAEIKVQSSGHTSISNIRPELIEGIVREIRMPDDLEAFADVEVVIHSDNNEHIRAPFRKCNVEAYYGLEGQWVSVAGYISDANPHVLMTAHHNAPRADPAEQPSYTQEYRELRGFVYNMSPSEDIQGVTTTTLVLSDTVYLSKVTCLFTTDHERRQLSSVRLGDQILIRGQVTLRNGRPIVLVGPELVDHANDGTDIKAYSDYENCK